MDSVYWTQNQHNFRLKSPWFDVKNSDFKLSSKETNILIQKVLNLVVISNERIEEMLRFDVYMKKINAFSHQFTPLTVLFHIVSFASKFELSNGIIKWMSSLCTKVNASSSIFASKEHCFCYIINGFANRITFNRMFFVSSPKIKWQSIFCSWFFSASIEKLWLSPIETEKCYRKIEILIAKMEKSQF